MKSLTKGRYRGRDGLWAVFDLEHGVDLRVGFLEHDIGRVVMRRDGGYRLDRGWSIAPGGLEPPYEGRCRDDLAGFSCPDTTVIVGERRVTIAGAALTAVVTLSPFGIVWRRAGEVEPFLRDRQTQAYFVSPRTGAVSHYLARHKAERHYGLGDKSGPLDRTGRRFRIDAVDPCGFDAERSDPLYKMIPFYVVDGPAGPHGIYYDCYAVGEVDLGETIDNYHGLFRTWRAEEGDLDYYVLGAPTVPDIVRRFSWLTGGQAFAPRWTLGFAQTSMAIADAPDAQARVRDFADQCKARQIPCDSFHFGSGYTMIKGRRYAFHWNRDTFPDPQGTLAHLNAVGLHPVTNLKPCLLDDHPRLHELIRDGGLVLDGQSGKPAVAQFWDGLGYHLDFTHPHGRAWWRAGIESALLDYGVQAVWNDNNEYEIWDEDAVCHGDGRPFPQRLARPAQPLIMTKLSFQTQAEHKPGKRPYAITRGGSAGIGRYAQTWSGDNATAWKTLRFNLTQGLNMSLTGMFNIGHDAGGFHGPSPGPELLVRFVEFCSFWPRFVMNSWNDDGVTTLPWMYPQVIPQVREAIRLRYRLMPYLYTQLWRASRDDVPVVQPLFFAFPLDEAARTVEDAFMVGPDVLVAPVLEEGATTRRVYLPKNRGGWYVFHDGSHHAGGAAAEVAAPLGRLPLFVRAGALLPLSGLLDRIDPAADSNREVIVYGSAAHSTAELYEDDGDTADWRTGAGMTIRLATTQENGATIVAATAEGSWRPAFETIRLRGVGNNALRCGAANGIGLELA